MKMLNDCTLIEPIERKDNGGILLPDEVRFSHDEGKVIAVGPGRRNKRWILIPTTLKPGDLVLLPKHEGIKLTHNNKKLEIFFEKDILAVQNPTVKTRTKHRQPV